MQPATVVHWDNIMQENKTKWPQCDTCCHIIILQNKTYLQKKKKNIILIKLQDIFKSNGCKSHAC